MLERAVHLNARSLVSLLSALLAAAGLASCGKGADNLGTGLSGDYAAVSIPDADWYGPGEFDILPRLIPVREPRPWTQADYARFWLDPAALDQQPLEAAARESVETLLRNVP